MVNFKQLFVDFFLWLACIKISNHCSTYIQGCDNICLEPKKKKEDMKCCNSVIYEKPKTIKKIVTTS